METYNQISTHVNIEIIKACDDARTGRLKAMDLLPIVAAQIFHLDENEDVSKRAPIYSAVKGLKRRKALAYMSYTKEALQDALQYRWVVTKDRAEMESLLTGITIILGFDYEGCVMLDEAKCKVYRDLAAKPNYKPLVFSGQKTFKASDNENLTAVHQILDYPPFCGLRIWSWKCEPDNYKDGYPDEMCCVGKNEWFDRSLKDVASFGEFKKLRGDDGHKGTVTRAWWDFANTIKDGDLLLYRDWRNDLIVGIGRFVGDYMYKPEKENCRSCRKIEWLSKNHYPSPTHVGEGNTSPMEIDNPKQLKLLLPVIVDVLKENTPK